MKYTKYFVLFIIIIELQLLRNEFSKIIDIIQYKY